MFDALLGQFTADRRMQNFEEVGRKINRRLQLDEKVHNRVDLLSPVMGPISETPGNDQITKNELVVHSFSTVAVNSQATTSVLASITYVLLVNQRAMVRLRDEIDQMQFRSTKDITVETTTTMPYLDAVINESLRIHHPTPMSLPRVVPTGGKIVMGQRLPAKMRAYSY